MRQLFADLRRLVSQFTNVLRVYIPPKVDKRGQKFGFVRLPRSSDASHFIRLLNGTFVGDRLQKIHAALARSSIVSCASSGSTVVRHSHSHKYVSPPKPLVVPSFVKSDFDLAASVISSSLVGGSSKCYSFSNDIFLASVASGVEVFNAPIEISHLSMGKHGGCSSSITMDQQICKAKAHSTSRKDKGSCPLFPFSKSLLLRRCNVNSFRGVKKTSKAKVSKSASASVRSALPFLPSKPTHDQDSSFPFDECGQSCDSGSDASSDNCSESDGLDLPNIPEVNLAVDFQEYFEPNSTPSREELNSDILRRTMEFGDLIGLSINGSKDEARDFLRSNAMEILQRRS
ncbi:hypothetical protein LINPERPRIM_LOCUS31765 [Linum perenne]